MQSLAVGPSPNISRPARISRSTVYGKRLVVGAVSEQQATQATVPEMSGVVVRLRRPCPWTGAAYLHHPCDTVPAPPPGVINEEARRITAAARLLLLLLLLIN